jgi:hypothetical protein
MSPVARRTKPDPNRVYVSWQPFSTDQYTIAGGERVRGAIR